MYEESIDHILLHCAKTRTLWVLFFTLFGVQWVLPASFKMTLLGWNGSFVGKKRKEVWTTNPMYFLDNLEGNVKNLKKNMKEFEDKIWRNTSIHSVIPTFTMNK